MKEDKIITNDFISKYQNKQPNWGFNGLGYIVYKRCVDVSTPVLCDDLTWRPAGELKEGQGIIGFDDVPVKNKKSASRYLRLGKVMYNKIEDAECMGVELEDGEIIYCTPDHRWLIKNDSFASIEWRETQHLTNLKNDTYLLRPFGKPWQQNKSYEAGFVSAAYDGEGNLDRVDGIQFVQVDNPLLDQTKQFLDKLEIKYKQGEKSSFSNIEYKNKRQQCYNLRTYGTKNLFRFLGELRPPRLLKKLKNNLRIKSDEKFGKLMRCNPEDYVKVKRVFNAGQRKIAVLSTDIETHFTGGFASHNTYARNIEGQNRTEEWHETIQRCINGAQKIGANYTKEEAEKLFDYIFNLKCNLAGRMLWQLGTSTVDRFGANSLLNCFDRNTEILTNKGVKKIGNLEGQIVTLMTEYGKWVEAPIKSFGQQKIWELNLSRGKTKKTIRTTEGHRWFRKPRRHGIERNMHSKIECITDELKKGDKLSSTYGQSVKNVIISNFGVAHGIVFGDGSVSNNVGNIRLCGDKNKNLLKFFNNQRYSDLENGDVLVGGLPKYFKEKPSLDMDKGYLYGWLAGYFAADGSIKDNGQIRLASAKKENLEFVRDVCVRLGVTYTSITHQDRIGLGKEETRLYSIGISGLDLTEDFFIVDSQLSSFLNQTYKPHMDWKVESVLETDAIEEVYCAVVPETHSFVLEGNILTGNCWFTNINSINSFCFLFENLMLGGGVGFSVRKEDIHDLPKVKKEVSIQIKNTKDADYIVPDSREGWVSLLRKVLESYFETGKSFNYSTVLIRSAGELISGFGGTASGPKILEDGIEKICNVIKAREGKKLRSIDCLDICNIIGSVVVAGNVRRSAEIALGDPDDFLFLRAKRWDLGNIPNHRAMSNNTIYADDYDHIMENVWDGYAGNGEPYGFFNLPLSQSKGRVKDSANKSDVNACGTNPCQPAWVPILTKSGIRKLSDVKIGEHIWSGSGWTKVLNKWSTGIKKVYRYSTNAGSFYGTENHRLVSNGEKVEAQYSDSIDNITGPYEKPILELQDIMDGLVVGDGSVHKASNNKVYLCVGEDDQDYFKSEIKSFIIKPNKISDDYGYDVKTTITHNDLKSTHSREVPDRFYYGDKDKVSGFLRGVYSANGSVVNNRITYKTASPKLRDQIQVMLSSVGIRSYYTTNKSKSVEFSNGTYQCRESYDINISTDREKFVNSIGFIQNYKNDKIKIKKSNRVKSTYDITSTELISEEEVFDITVDNESHTYWTGGCNVSNCGEITLENYECCNLSELYLNNIESKEELVECSKLLYKTQKAICALPFIHEETNKVVHKNFRIGQGVTGICQSLHKVEWLDYAYEKLKSFDKEWSKKMGWPKSIKLTTVKPSGTLSILAGSTPGVHPAFSRYYIRRIRMSSSDGLINLCKDLGYKVEYALNFDGTTNHDTSIVEFPCYSGEEATLAKDMSAIKQLEIVKTIQSEWSDNAVSCTVYYKKEELPEIKEWLRENYKNNIKSVSFLLHAEHGFQQAPYEEIDEKIYKKLKSKTKPIDSIIGNKIQSGGSLEGVECEGGACPIK